MRDLINYNEMCRAIISDIELADILGVSRHTVDAWIENKRYVSHELETGQKVFFVSDLKHIPQINEMINSSFVQDWPAERVELTLKAILQAGTAELLGFPETPLAIIITEYIDIAKSFYSGPEIKVTNGILDRLAKILRES